MPRTKRIISVDAALHITSRGNNRQLVFQNDSDKLYYRTLMEELKDDNMIIFYHYCLMNNHIHFQLRLKLESDLAKFMKQLNLRYSHYYKKLYGYVGRLWQERFKSNIILDDSYLLQCGKYIELNPVRAGIVKRPEDYLFSSYNFYAKGKPDTLITPNPVYLEMSYSAALRRKRYADFVVDERVVYSGLFGWAKKN
ncbi:MAG: transposase [Candidatus Omnitrophica bacterium]|jgi:putative transposase|nr:transposase [Candidatus Omnitrophota bacterium]MDD5078427.1 transposase [Candidatus Omnitrophota bacterium]MDD5725047.1 transposase [Candidatus Omnitrophota bacterium]